ncbi:hypothetical protein GW17_00050413, partial [Ensete ventricosum]
MTHSHRSRPRDIRRRGAPPPCPVRTDGGAHGRGDAESPERVIRSRGPDVVSEASFRMAPTTTKPGLDRVKPRGVVRWQRKRPPAAPSVRL